MGGPEAQPTDKVVAVLNDRFQCTDQEHPATQAVRRKAEELLLDGAQEGAFPGESAAKVETFNPLDPIDLLRSEMKLPALPQVFTELQAVMQDEKSSAQDLAKVISKDASLSSFLLRIVNSAFYSFPAKIETISRAVAVIGTGQLSALATGMSLMPLFKEGLPEGMSLERFWQHSIACGVTARALGRALGESDVERLFVAGLLHDLGRLAMFRSEQSRAEAVMALQRSDRAPFYAHETAVFGFDHARFGGMLLRKWNLPYPLVMAVLNHHQPAKDEKNREPWVVHVADFVVNGIGYGGAQVYCVPPIDPAAWERLGLTVELLEGVLESLPEQCEEFFKILLK